MFLLQMGSLENWSRETWNESPAKETLKAVLKGVEQKVEIKGNRGYYEVGSLLFKPTTISNGDFNNTIVLCFSLNIHQLLIKIMF